MKKPLASIWAVAFGLSVFSLSGAAWAGAGMPPTAPPSTAQSPTAFTEAQLLERAVGAYTLGHLPEGVDVPLPPQATVLGAVGQYSGWGWEVYASSALSPQQVNDFYRHAAAQNAGWTLLEDNAQQRAEAGIGFLSSGKDQAASNWLRLIRKDPLTLLILTASPQDDGQTGDGQTAVNLKVLQGEAAETSLQFDEQLGRNNLLPALPAPSYAHLMSATSGTSSDGWYTANAELEGFQTAEQAGAYYAAQLQKLGWKPLRPSNGLTTLWEIDAADGLPARQGLLKFKQGEGGVIKAALLVWEK